MLIIANPIYDSVFKSLMEDVETARGIVAALIGRQVVGLQIIPQEHVRRDSDSGDMVVFRMDFCATIQTAPGERIQVIIELQKANLGGNALRFRHYLAHRYQTTDLQEVSVGGKTRQRQVCLPIISVYLLGYLLEEAYPMAVSVKRGYFDAVTGEALHAVSRNDFIEQLTHDAFFIQIPKIHGQMGTELERVLLVFDQHRVVEGDIHRLEFDEEWVQGDPLMARILRALNRLQENPEMEKLMTLEDIYLFEQRELAEEAEWAREELRAQRKQLEEEQKRREEEQKRREEAEREIQRLRKLLDEREDRG
jgi:hypothetical protein